MIHETDRVQGGELETPVEETTAPEDSFPTASLAAELRARENDKALAVKATDAANGASLPATLAESVALLRQVQATPPATKFESRVRTIGLQRLAAHVHRLSQGPTAPPLDYSQLKPKVPESALAWVAGLYKRKP